MRTDVGRRPATNVELAVQTVRVAGQVLSVDLFDQLPLHREQRDGHTMLGVVARHHRRCGARCERVHMLATDSKSRPCVAAVTDTRDAAHKARADLIEWRDALQGVLDLLQHGDDPEHLPQSRAEHRMWKVATWLIYGSGSSRPEIRSIGLGTQISMDDLHNCGLQREDLIGQFRFQVESFTQRIGEKDALIAAEDDWWADIESLPQIYLLDAGMASL